MPNRFALRRHAIMTTPAVIHDTRMIKECRQETAACVTFTAIAIGWHVIEGFTDGEHSIVA